jgi:hypothetical protein
MVEETDISSSHNADEEESVSSSHNADEEESVSSSHNADEEESVSVVSTSSHNAQAEEQDSAVADFEEAANEEEPTTNENNSGIDDDVDNFTWSSDEEGEPGSIQPPPELPLANTDADEELEEEDIPLHGEIPVEPQNVHKAKWENYITEKAQLLSEGWEVIKAITSEGISVGATVRTRAQPRRDGLVTGEAFIGPDEKKHWIVSFDETTEPEPLRPLQLSLVQSSEQEAYVWKLVSDSEPDQAMATEEYVDGTGFVGFNFTDEFREAPDEAYNFPYLTLFQKMWPGDWRQQLRQHNVKIGADNSMGIAAAKKNFKKVNLVTENEWWVFLGVLVSAGPHGKGGVKLWEKRREGRGMTHTINYGPDGDDIMAYYRFNEIKAVFPWAFQDKSKEPSLDEEGNAVLEDGKDPWHMIMLMVDGYNKNRHEWVAASVRKVLDESMSAWCPQTTKTGGLPHLSFILRKPEPLGTEFKVIACAVTGMLLPSCLSS